MKNLLIIFALLAIPFCMTGCASTSMNNLSKVMPGMTKHDVLQLLGNPTRTTRALNQDRWEYSPNQISNKGSTYLFFDQGTLTHIDDKPMPRKPASPEITTAKTNGFKPVESKEDPKK